MIKSRRYWLLVAVLLALSATVLVCVLRDGKIAITQWNLVGRPADIHPDYSGVVIPPNIAPLNFLVREEGSYYCVKISSIYGSAIEVFNRSPKIIIPQKAWQKLLSKNKGQRLSFDIFVKTRDGSWDRFPPITNQIAREKIDDFLVYRLIRPVYSTGETAICQRDLRNYDDRLLLHRKNVRGVCVNCHTFCSNRTDKMFLGVRSRTHGSFTVLVQDDKISKLDARFGYTSWHPSGRLAVSLLIKCGSSFTPPEMKCATCLTSIQHCFITWLIHNL